MAENSQSVHCMQCRTVRSLVRCSVGISWRAEPSDGQMTVSSKLTVKHWVFKGIFRTAQTTSLSVLLKLHTSLLFEVKIMLKITQNQQLYLQKN